METQSPTRYNRTEDQQQRVWTRPEAGWFKCNVDGSFINSGTPAQAGWLVRDSMGTFKGASQSKGQKINNAFECEFQAMIMAMQHYWSQGYTKVILEGDCKKIINILNGKILHFEGYNWKREALRWKAKFSDICFSWIQRSCNRVADNLATRPLPNNTSFCHFSYIPSFATNNLHRDFVNSYNY